MSVDFCDAGCRSAEEDRATHASCIVVGVSGGLDSTLALLVSAQAVKNLGLPPETVTRYHDAGIWNNETDKEQFNYAYGAAWM